MASKKSEFTKKLRAKIITLSVIDGLLLFVPLATFFGIGLANEQSMVVEKVALCASAMVAIILVVFNILAKTHLRSAIWIMIIGLYIAVDDLMPLIITLAVVTILDEFLFTPTIKRLKTKYLASQTMDERGVK